MSYILILKLLSNIHYKSRLLFFICSDFDVTFVKNLCINIIYYLGENKFKNYPICSCKVTWYGFTKVLYRSMKTNDELMDFLNHFSPMLFLSNNIIRLIFARFKKPKVIKF